VLGRRKAEQHQASTLDHDESLHFMMQKQGAPVPNAPLTGYPYTVLNMAKTASINGQRLPHPPQYWNDVDLQRLILPLPVDQQLIKLVQLNVLRAIATNMSILSLHHLIRDNCTHAKALMTLFPAPSIIPASLMPTMLQQSTPHEGWIDMLPSPRMRDNAIRLRDTFDNLALCADLLGALGKGTQEATFEKNGLLVWSDPWHPRGWEVTEGFLHRWGFLLEGCHDMVESTNYWRAVRHVDPLEVCFWHNNTYGLAQ
jgi:hypothetical protein